MEVVEGLDQHSVFAPLSPLLARFPPDELVIPAAYAFVPATDLFEAEMLCYYN